MVLRDGWTIRKWETAMSFFVCPGFLRHRKQRASRAMACQLKFNCSVIYIKFRSIGR